MKQTIYLSQFRDAFTSIRPFNFSYEGLETLFNYLEETMGDDYELDVIALCCEWSEMDEDEILEEYDETPEELQMDTTALLIGNDRYIVCTDF